MGRLKREPRRRRRHARGPSKDLEPSAISHTRHRVRVVPSAVEAIDLAVGDEEEEEEEDLWRIRLRTIRDGDCEFLEVGSSSSSDDDESTTEPLTPSPESDPRHRELELIDLRDLSSSSASSSDSARSTDSSSSSSSDSDDDERRDVSRPLPLRWSLRSLRCGRSSSSSPPRQAWIGRAISDFHDLESEQPWRFVYRCLEMPFVSTPRSDRCGFWFERWDEFWAMHGRAVWERQYWAPFEQGSTASKQRKNRQARAVQAFRKLAVDLHHHFGDTLLDAIESGTHPGWWNRLRSPMSMLGLLERGDSCYTLHLSRYRERWPCGRRLLRRRGDPLWWLT